MSRSALELEEVRGPSAIGGGWRRSLELLYLIAATEFKKGQVFTVEPGLYLPTVGGVRHEDDGLVTENGFRVLSKFPKILEL